MIAISFGRDSISGLEMHLSANRGDPCQLAVQLRRRQLAGHEPEDQAAAGGGGGPAIAAAAGGHECFHVFRPQDRNGLQANVRT